MKTSEKIKRPWSWLRTVALALVAAACGSDDKTDSATDPTTDPTNAAGSTKASATGDLSAAFDQIEGYELAELPPEALDAARTQYQQEVSGNELAQQAVDDINGRLVTKDGEQIAIVLGMSFNPDLASQSGFQAGFVEGAAGKDSSTSKLSGEDATSFKSADGTQGVVFAKDRLGLLVIGSGGSEADLQYIMSKLIGNTA